MTWTTTPTAYSNSKTAFRQMFTVWKKRSETNFWYRQRQSRFLGHIARAALEATAFQVREVVEAMAQDSGVNADVLRVDGGMVANELLMQFQADILGVPVVRPKVAETTALGAAYAAGLAVGFFTGTEELVANWAMDHRWEPKMDDSKRKHIYRFWKKAVARSFDWAE